MACNTTLFTLPTDSCLLTANVANNTLSPEFHLPPSGSAVTEAVPNQSFPASEAIPEPTTLLVDASGSRNDSIRSQPTGSSISSSHDFLQNTVGGPKEHLTCTFQPESSASEKEQEQQQHNCRGECPCITNALLAHQDININLNGKAAIGGNAAYALNHHLGALAGSSQLLTAKQVTFLGLQQVPVETALHCIKSSLETCEMLMDCQTCSTRSECVMLSICMCDTMVARAEELVGAVDLSPSSMSAASSVDIESGAGKKALVSLDSNQMLSSAIRPPSQRKGSYCGPTCGPNDQCKISRRCLFTVVITIFC
jgi:hypothetical protein